jgi:NADPH2:quinone reductase
VDALGEGVVNLAVGDRVWVYLAAHQRPTGTAQEYTNVPADRVVKTASRTRALTSAPAWAYQQ